MQVKKIFLDRDACFSTNWRVLVQTYFSNTRPMLFATTAMDCFATKVPSQCCYVEPMEEFSKHC